MTDKERLEEIKNSFLEGQHILFGTSWVSMPKESFDLLIKQVEKVEQLQQENEKEQKRLRNQIYETVEEKFLLEKQLRQAQAKAERYKQALEFYANEETYETKFATDTDEICDPFTLIELDEGKKARKALGGRNMRERLEEIKNRTKYVTYREMGTDSVVQVEIVIEESDFRWLINRVEELEKEKDEWKDTAQSYYMTNQELREQNKRYREALEEISQKRMAYADMAGVLRIARQALGRERATERFEKEYKEL